MFFVIKEIVYNKNLNKLYDKIHEHVTCLASISSSFDGSLARQLDGSNASIEPVLHFAML